MQDKFKLSVFLVLFSLFLFPFPLNAGSEPAFDNPEVAISMDLQDASLRDILKILSIQSGLNFIASDTVQDRKITLYLDKVGIKQVMDKLFLANNLTYELDKGNNIFIVKDLGKPQVETITKVFYLKYATVSSSSLKEEMANINVDNSGSSSGSASSSSSSSSSSSASNTSGKWAKEEDSGITRAIKKILSEYGSVVEDFRTNSLVVTDIPSRMQNITDTIAALDVSVSQVMLEVEMLDVSKNALDKMGVKYQTDMTTSLFSALVQGASLSTGFPVPNDILSKFTSVATASGLSKNQYIPGTVSFGSNNISFDFIKQNLDAKTLARPKIMTLNNETAEIKIATNEVISINTTNNGTGSVVQTTTSAERVETGVMLRVTPQINTDTGEITMYINPRVIDASASSFADFKDPEERSTKSTVRIKDGETVVIGGLIRNDKSVTLTKVPILGDIPVLGALFRQKSTDKNRERELLVFITPHIIKTPDLKTMQIQKLNLPMREQGAAPGLSRDYLVNSSLNNFDKKSK